MPATGIDTASNQAQEQQHEHGPLIGLTGATGFVGSRLSQHLLQQGRRLRLLVRADPQRLPVTLRQHAELISGDLHNTAALQAFSADCDVVIHCAASVRGNSWHDYASANVQGTSNLLSAMQAQGCCYLLHVSSLAASQPGLSWYSRSKQQAEHVIAASGVPALVLRPPAIYGPGDRELRPLLDMLFRGGLVLRVTPPQQRLAMLHVDDLCAAISAVLSARPEGCYSIDDGNELGYDWHDLRLAMQQLSGRRVRSVQLPAAILHTLALMNLHWSRLRRSRSMLNPGKARELRWLDWQAHAPRIQETLDWQPRYRLQDGLQSLYAGVHGHQETAD